MATSRRQRLEVSDIDPKIVAHMRKCSTPDRKCRGTILQEALQEECSVTTSDCIRSNLVFIDMDEEFAMFRNLSVPTIVLIQLDEILAIEFSEEDENEES